jgi:hypothetical protein
VVHAKDWASKIKLGELIKFHKILELLPGQPVGLFITRTGYKKSAAIMQTFMESNYLRFGNLPTISPPAFPKRGSRRNNHEKRKSSLVYGLIDVR